MIETYIACKNDVVMKGMFVSCIIMCSTIIIFRRLIITIRYWTLKTKLWMALIYIRVGKTV